MIETEISRRLDLTPSELEPLQVFQGQIMTPLTSQLDHGGEVIHWFKFKKSGDEEARPESVIIRGEVPDGFIQKVKPGVSVIITGQECRDLRSRGKRMRLKAKRIHATKVKFPH